MNNLNHTKKYTAVKCFFNSANEIVRKHYINLLPMTHSETVTFISKQSNPSDWIVEVLPSFNKTLLTPDTINKTYDHFFQLSCHCIDEVLDGSVKVNDTNAYINKCEQDKLRYVNKVDSYSFTFLQRAHWIQTGECVGLLG